MLGIRAHPIPIGHTVEKGGRQQLVGMSYDRLEPEKHF